METTQESKSYISENTLNTPISSTNIIFSPDNKLQRPRGCLYIFYEKEFRDKNKPIYKIGYTSRNARDRLLGYSSDTKIVLEFYLNLPPNEIMDIETEIKRKFRVRFVPCLPSTERFAGDIEEIKKYFIEIIEEKTRDKDITFAEDVLYFPTKMTEYQEEKQNRTWDKMAEFIQSLTQEQLDDLEKDFEERKKLKYQYDESLEYNFNKK